MKYTWREGRSWPVSAQVAGTHIKKLQLRYGRTTPSVVLADAAKRQSPLHKVFPWDDQQAAHAHRLWLARELLGSLTVVVRVTPGQPPKTLRAFVALPSRDEKDRDYIPMTAVLSNKEMRRVLVSQGVAELDRWVQKYGHLREFAAIVNAIQATSARRSA